MSNQGVISWQQAGMPIAAKTFMNSEKILIVYQDDHNLYVVGSYQYQAKQRTKVVVIGRSLVDLILPEPDR